MNFQIPNPQSQTNSKFQTQNSNVCPRQRARLEFGSWILFGFWILSFGFPPVPAAAAESGDLVAIVYNKRVPESKTVAQHYADARQVPARNIIGLNLPVTESITRDDFKKQLQTPLFKEFIDRQWLELNSARRPNPLPSTFRPILGAKIRYLVLCYGVPLKITEDSALNEPGTEQLRPELRRNCAAVDSELALLPILREKTRLAGPLPNPFFGATNSALFHPTNGLLIVARLDGPTADIALRLVDKVKTAETNGFWGRAYIDARGLTNGEYKIGDDWMRGAANVTRGLGFETVFDDFPATFSPGMPMSHVALYAGWYDGDVSGPFTRPRVEFMPGAFAYHLHSYSASTLRSASAHWVGPLLARGASLTMGSVDEPYISGTPNMAVFMERLLWNRYTYGEAAYACQSVLSWQTTVIGDPLFRPMAEPPDILHYRLEGETNSTVEWSHLRILNLNLARKASSPDELLKHLDDTPLTKASAILREKQGDLLRAQGKLSAAAEAYAAAATTPRASPQQKIRLLLTAGQLHNILGREKEAYAAYAQLLADAPDYPDLAAIYPRLIKLGRAIGKTKETEQFEKALKKLTGPRPPEAK